MRFYPKFRLCKWALVVSMILFTFSSCQRNTGESPVVQSLESESKEAVSPYLTTDERGNAVLAWMEKDPVDSVFRMKYAAYDRKKNKFGTAVTIPGSEGAQTGAENMGKVAFKSNGTVVAVFGRKFLHEKNPFAGAIYFTISTNKGRSWSAPRYLHSDTVRNYGRGFFDLITLRNGEVGAAWLDGRFGKSEAGSAIFFSSTTPGAGFGKDRLVDRNTCECCRTDLLVDRRGIVHLAFRKILSPQELMGKQVRDMVYTRSRDNGQTFAPAKPISKDHWAIDGCPHTGPSLAMVNGRPAATWFTAGGTPGLYFTELSQPERFSPRQLISAGGRHPQMVSAPGDRAIIVWDEGKEQQDHAAGHHAGMNKQPASLLTSISVNLYKEGKLEKNLFRTSGNTVGHHAVMAAVQGGVLVAWVGETGAKSAIQYTFIPLER